MNLLFNGIMWTLFTQALAKGNSTIQVSIINTGANFMLTAVLGLMIFSESLPPLWWLGATLLVAGNVIVGRKDEAADAGTAAAADGSGAYAPVSAQGGDDAYQDDFDATSPKATRHQEDEDIIHLGDLTGLEASGAEGR